MTTAEISWLHQEDYPTSPTPTDLFEFFGIPPDPESALDSNIRSKRKHWRSKNSKARTDEAIKFTDAVLQAIAEAEDFLKRGSAVDPSAAGKKEYAPGPTKQATTIDDLWREIESLLFRGRYSDALERVSAGEDQWGTFPRYRDMRSLVVLEVVQNGDATAVDSSLLDRAIDDARSVLEQLGPDEPRYVTLIELLDAARRSDEADRIFDEALAALDAPSAEFRARQLQIMARSKQWLPILKYAVDLVEADPDDRGLRSEIVQLLVRLAKERLLPIGRKENISQYKEVIDVAAWCAEGVPEAEDFVRPHRMWASNCDQPIFAGNWQWRAFFAVVTGFISLPIHNSAASKPAWQVLRDGPVRIEEGKRQSQRKVNTGNRAYFMVTRNGYVEFVHESVKLPWQTAPDRWIQVEAVFDF